MEPTELEQYKEPEDETPYREQRVRAEFWDPGDRDLERKIGARRQDGLEGARQRSESRRPMIGRKEQEETEIERSLWDS